MTIELTSVEVEMILRALEVYRLRNLNPQIAIMGMMGEERQGELSAEGERLRSLLRKLEGRG